MMTNPDKNEDQESNNSEKLTSSVITAGEKKSPFGGLVAIMIGLAIGWLIVVPMYRMIRTYQWKEQLRTAETFDEMRETILLMMISDKNYAKATLADMAEKTDLVAYDRENNTMLLISSEDFQPHTFSPGYSSRRPYLTGKFGNAQLVESFPELSIFSAADENNGKVTLFVMSDKRVEFMAPMTPSEFEALQTEGLWQAVNALLQSNEQ